MRSSSVFNCTLLELPKIYNRNGNITPIQFAETIPFEIKRVYYLYDVPGGEARGGHAHIELQQYIIAASGSFDVTIDDGKIKRTINLNRPYYALQIVPGVWRELINFSSGSICLVLASQIYDEKDYIRNYDDFIKYKTI